MDRIPEIGKGGVIKKFVILIIFFFSCLEKPKLPDWDTEITIPLLEKKFTVFSFLDSHYFVINSDSTVNIFYQNKFDTIFPIKKINFNSDSFGIFYYFNNFEIGDTFFGEVIIDIEEILGMTIPDSYLILPPINQKRELEKSMNINDFRNCFIEEAHLVIEIENCSPINFKYFNIKLEDYNFALGNIEPNSQKEIFSRVNNIFISSPIYLLLDYRIFNNDSILVRKRDYLKLKLKFSNIKIREGELKLKRGYLKHIYNYCFIPSGEFDLDYGEIKEGYLDLDFVNQFPFPLLINFEIAEINYKDSVSILAFNTQKISFSLQGKTVKKNFPDKEGFFFSIEIDAQIRDTENFFNISRENNFSIWFQIRELKLKEAIGNFLAPFYFLNRQDTLLINFLGNPKGIKFEKTEMSLDFIYDTKIPIEIFFIGKSINRNQETCFLYREIELPVRNEPPPYQMNEKIDLADLMNIGPKVLKFNYLGRIKSKGKLEEKDFILLNATFELPLKFFFDQDTFIAYEKEIFLDEKKRESIEKNLVGGELVIELINHLPFGFSGSLILVSEKDSLEFPFKLVSGEVSEKGYCVKEKENKVIWEMKENQLGIFKKERLKTFLKVELPESDTIVLRSCDFLSFKSYALLKVKTKEVLKSIKKKVK